MDTETNKKLKSEQDKFSAYVNCINSNNCSCEDLLHEAVEDIQKSTIDECFNGTKIINNDIKKS